jgi:toxin secretion/phage lysis holin
MPAPDKATEIKAIFTGIFAFLTALWGWVGWAVLIMMISMFLDYVTGSWAAKAKGEWSSAIARQGLWHKLGEITALLVAALCDIAVQVIVSSGAAPLSDIEYEGYITIIVAVWYIFTEVGSILENAQELGAPIPDWLVKGVAKMKRQTNDIQTTAEAVSNLDTQQLAAAIVEYVGKHEAKKEKPPDA